MKRYLCKLFNYAHTGLHVEEPGERDAWRTLPLEPFAVVEVRGDDARDAAAFAYVLTCGIDRAMKLRSLNAPHVVIRVELDISRIASSLKEERCSFGPCLLIDSNPCEIFYIIIEEES